MQTYEFWVATRSHPTTFLDDFIMAEPVCCAVATMTNPPAFSHSTSENLKYTRRRSTFIGRRRSRNRKRLLLQLMSTVLLLSPAVQPYLRSPRRFWCADRGLHGFWETEVNLNWITMGNQFADWEEKQYLYHYRVSKATFLYLCNSYGKYMKKKDTKLRKAVPFAKRFAIVLHWLAHSLSFMQVSALYAVAKSTVISIVHEGVSVLLQRLVPVSIKFPTGSELDQVITDLETLCGLPFCAGAIDGTFMEIKKPTEFGDTYYCYKRFNAIIILGCVDARGIFTYVNAGRPGSVGDAYTYRNSPLYQKLNISQEWLNCTPRQIEGSFVKPYLVVDSAFALACNMVKCYDSTNLSHR